MKEICNVSEFTGDANYPVIKSLISDVSIPEKAIISKYLKSFTPDCASGMSLTDEITGEDLNSGVSGYEDGMYYWDTRHIYQFEKYNLKLNDDFIKFVLSR